MKAALISDSTRQIAVKWEHGTDGVGRLMLQKWTVDGVDFTYADADLGCPDPATMTDTKHKAYMFMPKVFGTNFGITGFIADQSNDLELLLQPDTSYCPTCPAGKFAPIHRDHCTNCADGKFAAYNLTGPTGDGNQYIPINPNLRQCEGCPAGKYSENFSTQSGNIACLMCPGGKFSGVDDRHSLGAIAAPSCSRCEQGRYFGTTEAPACKECELGQYSGLYALACTTECAEGQFSGLTADTAPVCATCPMGKFGGGPFVGIKPWPHTPSGASMGARSGCSHQNGYLVVSTNAQYHSSRHGSHYGAANPFTTDCAIDDSNRNGVSVNYTAYHYTTYKFKMKIAKSVTAGVSPCGTAIRPISTASQSSCKL
jgi:hypothetical protein